MENNKSIWLLVCFFITACGTNNYFESLEKKPGALQNAALLLEKGQPEKAQTEILKQLPASSQLLLQDTTFSSNVSDSSFSKNLAASLAGTKNAGELLGVYASAEAQKQDVNALSIMAGVLEIEGGSASLALSDSSGDDAAIAKFGPAMPKKCNLDPTPIIGGLILAIKIMEAVAIIHGFSSDDFDNHLEEVRISMGKEAVFTAGIYAQVAFICPVLNYDTGKDKKISQEEADAITDDQAIQLYDIISLGIAYMKALSSLTPDDKELAKGYKRMQAYKDGIDNASETFTLAQKVRAFLVANSK